MRIHHILVALLIIHGGCKESRKTAATQDASSQHVDSAVVATPAEAEKNIQSGDSLMRFIVSFYSIGSGVERGKPEILRAYVESFEKKINKKVDYKETHWGREGETDFCFPLVNLNRDETTDFISGIRHELKSAQFVNYFENQACRKGR